MSRDSEDKEQEVPAENENPSASRSVTEEDHDEPRRKFLKNLGKWSGAAIGIALLGSAVCSTDADADNRDKPEESWRCARCRCRCRCL